MNVNSVSNIGEKINWKRRRKSMEQKSYDNLEFSIILLGSLRDTMISIESADSLQMVPATTLVTFETVIEKVQILLNEIKKSKEKEK